MKWYEIALIVVGSGIGLFIINFFIFYPLIKALEDMKQRPKF